VFGVDGRQNSLIVYSNKTLFSTSGRLRDAAFLENGPVFAAGEKRMGTEAAGEAYCPRFPQNIPLFLKKDRGPGEGKNFFSREKKFFPSPGPLSLFKKSDIF